MEQAHLLQGDISPHQLNPTWERQAHTCYSPYGLADHPDQRELDLHWPGVPRLEELGLASRPDLQMTCRLVSAVVEALDGRRPVAQLQAHLHPQVYAAMQTRVRQTPTLPRVTRVRSLHAFQPAEGAIEAAASLERAGRVTALAARLQ